MNYCILTSTKPQEGRGSCVVNEVDITMDLSPGARSSKVPKTFRPRKAILNLPTACSGKPIFWHVFKVTKSKLTVKFDHSNTLLS